MRRRRRNGGALRPLPRFPASPHRRTLPDARVAAAVRRMTASSPQRQGPPRRASPKHPLQSRPFEICGHPGRSARHPQSIFRPSRLNHPQSPASFLPSFPHSFPPCPAFLSASWPCFLSCAACPPNRSCPFSLVRDLAGYRSLHNPPSFRVSLPAAPLKARDADQPLASAG
jgi:hypothetical protein